MRLQPARKAANVINDDDMRISAAMLLEKSQHRQHCWPIDYATRCAFFAEHLDHLVALGARILATACFLRAKPRAARDLLRVGDAAVNDGFGRRERVHKAGVFLG